MPDIDFDDDDLDFTDPNLVKQLRKQLREKDKDLKSAQETLKSLSVKDRTRTIADTFKEFNVPAKVAGFYPADKEATEDSIKAWLVEHADVFGLKLDAPPEGAPKAPAVPEGMGRLDQISQPSNALGADDAAIAQIKNMSEQELLAQIFAQGGMNVS